MKELDNISIINEIKAQSLRWAGYDRFIRLIWEENPAGKRALGRPGLKWRDNIMKDMNTVGGRPWWSAVDGDKSYLQQRPTKGCEAAARKRES